MIHAFWDAVQSYLQHGGTVMVPLVAGTFVLWYAVGYRAWALRRGTRLHVRELVGRRRAGRIGPPEGMLDHAVEAALAESARQVPAPDMRVRQALLPFEVQLGRGAVLARTIVVVAPLLGLLGTVSGMIEMFDSLGSQSFYTQDGGIAGGIAEALFTTQLGLAIAIPGYFVTRVLDRREERIRGELSQVENLCHLQHGEGTSA